MTTKTTFDEIKEAAEELKLLTLAYRCMAGIGIGAIAPEEYVKCLALLEQKLGFEATKENLDQAAQKYLQEK